MCSVSEPFSGLPASAPVIAYGYGTAGMASLTNPWGEEICYAMNPAEKNKNKKIKGEEEERRKAAVLENDFSVVFGHSPEKRGSTENQATPSLPPSLGTCLGCGHRAGVRGFSQSVITAAAGPPAPKLALLIQP